MGREIYVSKGLAATERSYSSLGQLLDKMVCRLWRSKRDGRPSAGGGWSRLVRRNAVKGVLEAIPNLCVYRIEIDIFS